MGLLAKILIAAVAVVAVLAGGLFAGWYFLVRSEAEPPAAIERARCTRGGALDGTYRLAPGDPDSFVGYRVREQFAGALESTATGRTSDVDGSLTITGTTVDDVTVTADLTTLTSDRDMRDNRIRTLGLESEQFPESTFTLTEPITVKVPERAKAPVNATATGDFTLHGVTTAVEIPLEACRDGDGVQVVGSLKVVFADYDMETPNVAGFVTVKDEGDMEFQLFFEKAGTAGRGNVSRLR